MTSSNGVQYRLTFVNNSSDVWTACLYQTDPSGNPDVQSLVWFAKPAAPGTSVGIEWTIDYSFYWGETGPLMPGVNVHHEQLWPANLTTANQVSFLRQPDGAYSFANQTAGPSPGSLSIIQQGSVVPGQASVGISMSGAGVFAFQASPNMNTVFTPHPTYWITAGMYAAGQVLDLNDVTNPQQIDFPPGVFAMTATLNPDDTWTVRVS